MVTQVLERYAFREAGLTRTLGCPQVLHAGRTFLEGRLDVAWPAGVGLSTQHRFGVPATLLLTCVLLTAPVGPSLVRGLLAVSLAINALFTSAYLYQSLR